MILGVLHEEYSDFFLLRIRSGWEKTGKQFEYFLIWWYSAYGKLTQLSRPRVRPAVLHRKDLNPL